MDRQSVTEIYMKRLESCFKHRSERYLQFVKDKCEMFIDQLKANNALVHHRQSCGLQTVDLHSQ